jgi:sugar phosphate isomerase/epimerase
MDRRTCLKTLGAAALGAGALSAKSVRSRLGLQLFTVREGLARDVEGTLGEVAALGYAEVEMFGFGGNAFIQDPLFGLTAREWRRILDAHGLEAPMTQISGRVEDPRPLADSAHTLGIRTLVVAMASEFLTMTPDGPTVSGVKDEEQVLRIAERLNRLGSLCRGEGLSLGYHNHHMELAPLGSSTAYDLLLERTDRDLVRMELDVGWARAGGAAPEEILAHYPGRFASCHLKDFAPDLPIPPDLPKAPIPDMRRMVAPGDGVVNFVKVLAEMDRQGVEHGFVESDLAADGMDVARRGIRYLRSLG